MALLWKGTETREGRHGSARLSGAFLRCCRCAQVRSAPSALAEPQPRAVTSGPVCLSARLPVCLPRWTRRTARLHASGASSAEHARTHTHKDKGSTDFTGLTEWSVSVNPCCRVTALSDVHVALKCQYRTLFNGGNIKKKKCQRRVGVPGRKTENIKGTIRADWSFN